MKQPREKRGPRWIESERIEREMEFRVPATPERVFPLLCPVLEYDWIPDWKCTMCYSDSGVAERDAVFITKDLFGAAAIYWYCVTYEPSRLVEYLLVSGTKAVVRLTLKLRPDGDGGTFVNWRMLMTATSRLGRLIGARQLGEKPFKTMLAERERQLAAYFAAR